MTENLSSHDIRQEGRLSAIEVKVERMHPLVEELHADMVLRNQSHADIGTITKILAWLVATILGVVGLIKSNVFYAHV